MKGSNPFAWRSIAVVNDLSIDEQRYLYHQCAILKKNWLEGKDLEAFRIQDPGLTIYLMFLEDSTRTKESFRNAAGFHQVKLYNFDVGTSSVQKSESLIDTVKTLFGYSHRSIFILRTKMEGVCRAMEEQLGDYSQRMGREKPAFINGGDGRHEHPTQEFLDQFTFLEHKNWDESSLHIALVGDLLHGRTVHSKVSGLRIFREVLVDLVAPEELTLPVSLLDEMKRNGFEIRSWPSLEAYLAASEKKAEIWYFTRLQLERMGEEIRKQSPKLRRAVSFRKEFLEKTPPHIRFYHPLPRHREYPVIPTFLDTTEFNGWDEQSMNGYFTRIVELALVAGKLGDDFRGKSKPSEKNPKDFVRSAPILKKSQVKDRHKVGIRPVDKGLVIDHIAPGLPLEDIWDRIDKIRRILKLNVRSSHGVFNSSTPGDFKGIISLPDIISVDRKDLKKLAAISPGCTLNIVDNCSVVKKYRLNMPPRIYNFDEIFCHNEECITYPAKRQNVPVSFERAKKDTFVCHYCGTYHNFKEIWGV